MRLVSVWRKFRSKITSSAQKRQEIHYIWSTVPSWKVTVNSWCKLNDTQQSASNEKLHSWRQRRRRKTTSGLSLQPFMIVDDGFAFRDVWETLNCRKIKSVMSKNAIRKLFTVSGFSAPYWKLPISSDSHTYGGSHRGSPYAPFDSPTPCCCKSSIDTATRLITVFFTTDAKSLDETLPNISPGRQLVHRLKHQPQVPTSPKLTLCRLSPFGRLSAEMGIAHCNSRFGTIAVLSLVTR